MISLNRSAAESWKASSIAAPAAKNAVAPLYGLRWPENAHAENLVATAWVEDAAGRITQIATDRCADPK